MAWLICRVDCGVWTVDCGRKGGKREEVCIDSPWLAAFSAVIAYLGFTLAKRVFFTPPKKYSVEMPGQPYKEGRVRRSVFRPYELLQRPLPNVRTLYDVLQHAIATSPSGNCFGFRQLIKMVEEEKTITKVVAGVERSEKKTWKFVQLSDYKWLTYKEVAIIVNEIGSGLLKLGLGPNTRATIFAGTSKEWLLFAHGCFSISCTITTAYDTLGEEGLLFSLNEGEIPLIFTTGDLLPMIGKTSQQVPTLKTVIYNGEATPENVAMLKERGLTVLSLDELRELGQRNKSEAIPPKPEDTACIMYTSGTTGNPKGVMLSHGNLVADIAGISDGISRIGIKRSDIYLAYLPLAHVLELVAEHACLFECVAIGYGSIRTLTDSSVRNCRGDICALRPSLMAGVPLVWESIRKGVATKLAQKSPLANTIFNACITAKYWCLQHNLPTVLFDMLVFNKVREQVGGRLRFVLSGGAPIAVGTQKFLTAALCPVLQGYGMTECCGGCTIMPPDCFAMGRAGAPLANIEVKLVDSENYTSQDAKRPRGEVWMRGPSIMQGYYKNQKATDEVLNADGWLATGDIGQWHEDGILSIIDRKKNLVKLAHGEYIALEKLECVYKSTYQVGNLCIYGDSYKNFPVAIISPAEAPLRALAKSNGIEEAGHSLEDLCKNKKLTSLVHDELEKVGKQAGLKSAEILGACFLTHVEWTAENGLLTAAQKLKRKEVVDKYKAEIDRMYA